MSDISSRTVTRAIVTVTPVVILNSMPCAAAISAPAMLLIPHSTLATVVRVLLSPPLLEARLSPLRTLRKRLRLVTVRVLVLRLILLLRAIIRSYISCTRHKYNLLCSFFVP